MSTETPGGMWPPAFPQLAERFRIIEERLTALDTVTRDLSTDLDVLTQLVLLLSERVRAEGAASADLAALRAEIEDRANP